MFLVILGGILLVLVVRWIRSSLRIKDIPGRYVFVTGCDSGFGNLLVRRLDTLGVHVFAGCFTTKAVEEYQTATSSRIVPVPLDITSTKSIQEAYQFVQTNIPEGKGLWALVNNAGTQGHYGPVTWLSEEDYQRPLSVNFFGMVRMVRVFLPLILKCRGRIVNMTSGSGKLAAANVGPYSISKYAAEAYSDTLRRELYKTGVSVHIIEPGAFSTGFTDIPLIKEVTSNNFEKLDDEMKEYYGEGYCKEICDSFGSLIKLIESPKLHKVTDAYQHAITSLYPRIRYVVGTDVTILMFLASYCPDAIVDFVFYSGAPTPKGRVYR